MEAEIGFRTRGTKCIFELNFRKPALCGRMRNCVSTQRECEPLAFKRAIVSAALALVVFAAPGAPAQEANSNSQAQAQTHQANLPPRVIQARRFLSERGWTPARGLTPKRSGMQIGRAEERRVGKECRSR